MATKPRLGFTSNKRPQPLDDNAPIVKKNDNTLYANKTELTDYIDLLYVHPSSDTYLYAECECGIEYEYATKNDVPASDVTCTCGRRIIEYNS